MIKKIVIIGGGTSGWVTTLNFLRYTDNPQIINISSEEIPIIGVGESTTGTMVDMIRDKRNIDIDELDFIKKTNSTFKYGIWHKDWQEKGKSFISPLGDEFLNKTGEPNANYDYYRIYHVAKDNMPYQQTQAEFMNNDKMLYLNVPSDDIYFGARPGDDIFNKDNGLIDFHNTHVAYHLDTFEVGNYIKEQVLKNNEVIHYNDIVSNVVKDEKGYVKKLILKSGKEVEGDLFVDCTGFFRLLIQDDNEFIDWSNNLLTNRAIAFPTDDYKITNYTTAQARQYGWEWNIPLQHRMGRGYVFNDRMIDVDQAVDEITKIYGKVNIVNDVKFTPGRMKNAWSKNVLSVGLSTGFVEPLEATAIHMSIVQVDLFLKNYYSDHLDCTKQAQQKNYNRAIGDTWDDIRDFIVAHYINTRQDTDFWKESSSKDRWSDRLKELMEIWSVRMPRISDYSSSNHMDFYKLGNTLWYQVLIGMKILNPKVAENELKSYRLYDMAEKELVERNKFNRHILPFGENTNDFYKNKINNLYEYRKVN